jgi:hypothetical protein
MAIKYNAVVPPTITVQSSDREVPKLAVQKHRPELLYGQVEKS